MIFQSHAPSKIAQPFIQCYLEADCRASIEGGENTLFPNGYSGIFFNFGNKGKLIIREEYEAPSVSIFGQIDRHFTIVHNPGFYSLGVLLKPTILSRLLRVDMAEFTNRAFDGALIRADFTILHHLLEEAEDIKRKIEILEGFFSKAFSFFNYQASITEQALYIMALSETHSIEKLARNMGVSQRCLEIDFKRSVGLSPKTYSMILRFKSIEQQVRKLPAIRWQDMEFASQYHDQTHFIKDFKRFTGLTPSAYLMEKLEMGRSYLNA